MPNILLALVFSSALQPSPSRPETLLQVADSLFSKQQYTQAYDKYLHIYEGEGYISLQMLLKMAYIKEGLEDYAHALHFLLEHHARTQDAAVWEKVAQLSHKQGFKGYTLHDTDYVWHFLRKHKPIALGGIATILLAFFVRFLHSCFHKKRKGLVPMLLCAGLGVAMLYLERLAPKTVVIGDDKTAFMHAPAAAAEIQTQLQKGDRVTLLAKNKAWATILWEKKKGYIRTQHILYAVKKSHEKNEG